MADQSSHASLARPGSKAFLSRGTLAVTIGNMLEFYDFITYSFFAIQIGHTFFPSESQFASLMLSLATFGAGFVTRPIGGIVIGSYSDRAGRRPAITLLAFTAGLTVNTICTEATSASGAKSMAGSNARCG
jgi:MFS family permease